MSKPLYMQLAELRDQYNEAVRHWHNVQEDYVALKAENDRLTTRVEEQRREMELLRQCETILRDTDLPYCDEECRGVLTALDALRAPRPAGSGEATPPSKT